MCRSWNWSSSLKLTKYAGNPILSPNEDHGWLMLYHGVGPDRYYRLGAMLLDLEEPWRVTHRTTDWILEPEHDFETRGGYGGGAVFPCGKVVIDGTLFVYYGTADKYIGLATAPLDAFLEDLLTCPV